MSGSLEVYIIINFKAQKISQCIDKLTRTSAFLIAKIVPWIGLSNNFRYRVKTCNFKYQDNPLVMQLLLLIKNNSPQIKCMDIYIKREEVRIILLVPLFSTSFF
jgi:hypothetical protein